MAKIPMREMLEAGVHFGHRTNRWDPRMKPYIFGARNGIYIIDLQQTVPLFDKAFDFLVKVTARGEKVLQVQGSVCCVTSIAGGDASLKNRVFPQQDKFSRSACADAYHGCFP